MNRKVAVFRTPFLGLKPEERATRAELRVLDVLGRNGPGTVTIRPEPQGNIIFIDGVLALGLLEGDADRLNGETLAEATQTTVRTLRQVITETQEARDRKQQLRALTRAGLATAGFLAAFALVWLLSKRAFRRLAGLLGRGSKEARPSGFRTLTLHWIITFARWFVRIATWLVLLPLTYEWVSFVLNQFPYTRPWSEHVDDFLVGLVRSLGLGILEGIPDLVVAIAIFVLARVALGLLRPFFERAESAERGTGLFDADTARPTRRIVNVAIWAFAVVMAYPYLPGSDSEAFKGVSVLIGLMISLGGSSVFGHGASGLILMYSRIIRVGEYVRISDHEGTVTELGTFTTKLRTGLGEEVSLPNALVLGTVTKNYSRAVQGAGYIVDTTVTIGYDTPWRQVEAMLVEAARRTSGVLGEPEPRVFKTALSDFYVEYRLVCQAIPSEPRPRAEVLHTLHSNALDVFNEHGVQIMSPHYLGDPADPKIVSQGNWYPAPTQAPEKPGVSGS